MPSLRFRKGDADRILASARAAAPDEACGILIGRRDGEARVVERVVDAKNVHPFPRSGYTLDPESLLFATLDAEEAGLEVVGFWHSHPRGPPRPSREDAALASWPVAYAIAWLAPEEGLGAWLWAEGRFEEMGIERP